MRLKFIVICLLAQVSAIAQYNFYYGNIHSHTEYSDGNKDSITSGVFNPGGSFAYAKGSYHTDFWGISEHNHFSATNNPGMLLSRYAQGLYQADTSNQNGTFVTMYGLEWGTISQGGHVVTYGSPGLIGWETLSGSPNYDTYCDKGDFTSYWNIVKNIPNCFTTLAHPQTGDYEDLLTSTSTFKTAADSSVVGCAVRSGDAFSTTTNYSDPAPASYETEFKQALAKGYHVGPTMDHDNHYTTFGRTNKTRTVVLSTVLNRDSIISAFRNRRFYASDDWNTQLSFTLNGNVMGSQFTTSNNSSISISVNDIDAGDNVQSILLYYGIPGSGATPTVLTSVSNSSTLNYTHTTTANANYYYYVKITQADGDKIWSAPIWIHRIIIPLPITISSFTAEAINKQIELNWVSSSEENIDKIELQHSKNGLDFESIHSFIPNNKKDIETTYSYLDENPVNGINYYRLKSTDFNNEYSYSNTVNASIAIEENTYSIFPNPVVNQLNILYISTNSSRATIKLYNQEGREVFFENVEINPSENSYNIDIEHLCSGIYYLVLQKENERLIDTKIIKE